MPSLLIKTYFTIFIGLIILIIGSASGNHSGIISNNNVSNETQIKLIYTKIGDTISFQWNSLRNRAIDYCRWDRLPLGSEPALSIISKRNNLDIQGYSILSKGLEQGYCQLTIDQVRKYDVTVWICTIVDKELSHEGVVTLGTANVTEIMKPSSPNLLHKEALQTLNDYDPLKNSTVDLYCCANGGHPLPKLSIVIDEKTLLESENFNIAQSQKHFEPTYCLELKNISLNWTFDKRQLSCKSVHPAFDENDDKEDSLLLNILHAPEIISELTPENEINFRLSPNSNSLISIEFSANPLATVHWLIKTSTGSYAQIPQQFNHDLRQNLENCNWATEITFNSNELSSNPTHFLLTVRNSLGYKEIYVNVEITFTNWFHIAAYIIAGCIATALVLGLSVFVAKRNGWLCFNKRSGKFVCKQRYAQTRQTEEAPEPEPSDPLAAEII